MTIWYNENNFYKTEEETEEENERRERERNDEVNDQGRKEREETGW